MNYSNDTESTQNPKKMSAIIDHILLGDFNATYDHFPRSYPKSIG